MRINVSDLRRAATLLFDALESKGVHTVDIEEHHYWTIARELRVNNYDPPQELTVGQLAEDWESLQRSLAAEGPPIGYALVWFAEILREVGETHPA